MKWIKMEQTLEFLKANEAKMECLLAGQREMKAHHEEMMAGLKRLKTTADA
jgi:hypothetical protein